jgi:hypothetical protein
MFGLTLPGLLHTAVSFNCRGCRTDCFGPLQTDFPKNLVGKMYVAKHPQQA